MLTVESLRSEIAALIKERDVLEGKVDKLEWENKGIAEWRGEYSALKKRYDPLMMAAKLALDALIETRDNGLSWDAEYDKAIKALKKAGVQ